MSDSTANESSTDQTPVERKSGGLWRDWVRPLAILMLVLFSFRSAVADWNDVPSQSMEPTLLVGDRIAVNKLAYGLRIPFTAIYIAKWSSPQRGEIIVFRSPEDGKRMVKRVIGVPGDRISMQVGRLIINGTAVEILRDPDMETEQFDLTDPPPHLFAAERIDEHEHLIMQLPDRRDAGGRREFDEIVVPDGQFFVMGDNRDNSRDSRVWDEQFRFVDRELIQGRVFGIAFSLDRKHSLSPRWDRFFAGVD